MSRARWQYASIKTKGIKLVPLHVLKDEQGTVHSRCLLLPRKGSSQFTILDLYLFLEVSGNASLISLWGNGVLSLMSRERLDDITVFVKVESQCHSFALHLRAMKS